jgi:hypothetical protein
LASTPGICAREKSSNRRDNNLQLQGTKTSYVRGPTFALKVS